MGLFEASHKGDRFGVRDARGRLVLDADAAARLNAIRAELRRLDRFAASPPLAYSSDAAGRRWQLDRPVSVYAKLTGTSGSAYTWAEATRSAAGVSSLLSGGRTGTAYEANLATGLTGKYATLDWTPASGDWRFQAIRAGAATCTGGVSGTVVSCSSVSVTATGPSGPTTVVFSGGTYFVNVSQGAGVYTVSISGGGIYSRSISVTWAGCGTSASFGSIFTRPTSVTVAVSAACANFASTGIDGATVTISGTQSGTCAVSGLHAAGCVVPLSDDGGNGPQGGTLSVAMDRYVGASQAFSGGMPCSLSIDLTTPSGCYMCCGYPFPISGNFHLTTPLGTFDLTGGSPTVRASATFHATVLSKPVSSLPTCPATPSCCTDNSTGSLGVCNCTATSSSNSVEFRASTDCSPNTSFAFRCCANDYGFASADGRNGFSQDANVLWDRTSEVYANGGYSITGTNCDEPTSGGSWAAYYNGSYTMTEIPCPGMSAGPAPGAFAGPAPETPAPAVEAGPPQYPGFLEMAANLARSATAHVMNGMQQSPPEVVAGREAACRACPMWDAAQDRCKSCGCHLPTKRAWESSTCPLHRWPGETTP